MTTELVTAWQHALRLLRDHARPESQINPYAAIRLAEAASPLVEPEGWHNAERLVKMVLQYGAGAAPFPHGTWIYAGPTCGKSTLKKIWPEIVDTDDLLPEDWGTLGTDGQSAHLNEVMLPVLRGVLNRGGRLLTNLWYDEIIAALGQPYRAFFRLPEDMHQLWMGRGTPEEPLDNMRAWYEGVTTSKKMPHLVLLPKGTFLMDVLEQR